MAKIVGTALMFGPDDIRETTAMLPRLMRIIFYALGITNENYMKRYWDWWREHHPDQTRKEFSQKAAADRGFVGDRRKLTINMATGLLSAMGQEVVTISFTLKDQLTGEVRTFSTDDTVEKIDQQIADDNTIGVSSLV